MASPTIRRWRDGDALLQRMKGQDVRTETQELTLQTALSDPLIGAVMAADNVDRAKLEATLLRIAASLTPSVPASIPAGCVCSA
jgi:hypothetical protein